MACDFPVDLSRQSELSVKLNRQLERCLRNSKCIDTESLCVVSGEKVKNAHAHISERRREKNLVMIIMMMISGVEDQSGRSRVEPRWQPDGRGQHRRHHRSVPLQTPGRQHPGG